MTALPTPDRKMKKQFVFVVAVAAISGCVTPPPPTDQDHFDAISPLTCTGAEQCNTWWRRAQFWVSGNSGYKIQIATDTLIETYNPTPYSTTWAFSIRREPLGTGQERFWIAANCSQRPACQSHHETIVADMKRYIRAQ